MKFLKTITKNFIKFHYWTSILYIYHLIFISNFDSYFWCSDKVCKRCEIILHSNIRILKNEALWKQRSHNKSPPFPWPEFGKLCYVSKFNCLKIPWLENFLTQKELNKTAEVNINIFLFNIQCEKISLDIAKYL